jgi:tetratricopeptide (TPR) repeat protein
MRIALLLLATTLCTQAAGQVSKRTPSSPKTRPSVAALHKVATVRASAGDYRGALETLNHALLIAPNSTQLLYDYGMAAMRARVPAEAVRALTAATRLDPENPEYLYLFGLSLLWVGDLESSIDPLARAAELDSDRASVHLAYAVALHGQKNLEDATVALERALALDPGNMEALYLLADISQSLGDFDAAAALARQVLAQHPKHPGANLVVGMALLKQGAFADARRALETAIAADPTLGRAHYQLSIVYSRLGDDARAKKARAAYEAAQRRTTDQSRALRRLLNPSDIKQTQ